MVQDQEGYIDPQQLAIDTAFPRMEKETRDASTASRLQRLKMVSRFPPDVINSQVALAVVGRRMKSTVIPMIIEEYATQRISIDGLGRDDLIAIMGVRVPEGEEGEV
jgi:hypothetical protein